MQHILTGASIAKAIGECCPTRVAVAYIGSDWMTFIPKPLSIEYVIVSPTLGTNPNAITHLAKIIGWSNIHFLDSLHAKIFLGSSSAIVGSANLTENGLSGENLLELGAYITDRHQVRKINDVMETWCTIAKEKYPSEESKKKRLEILNRLWNAAHAHSILPKESGASTSFEDFELLSNDQFYVLWYMPVPARHSSDLEKIESIIKDETHFVAQDKVVENKWALMWRIRCDDRPHRRSDPDWLYIHEVYKNGNIDKGYQYTQCAIQRKDAPLPPKPFKLTDTVISAFRHSIIKPELNRYFIQEDPFRLYKSFAGLPILLRNMRKTIEGANLVRAGI